MQEQAVIGLRDELCRVYLALDRITRYVPGGIRDQEVQKAFGSLIQAMDFVDDVLLSEMEEPGSH